MRKMMCFLMVIVVAGCASAPIPAEKADAVPAARLHAYQNPASGLATLLVTRDRGFVGSGCNTRLFIKGELAAEIASGESARFYLDPEPTIVSITGAALCSTGLKEREVSLSAGKTTRYRISIDGSMSMDLSPTAF